MDMTRDHESVNKSLQDKPWKQKRKIVHKKDDLKAVEIFEGKPMKPGPSLLESTPAENGYIEIICMNESKFIVPLKVVDSFKCVDVILHSEVSFKERLENVIRFPDMSSEVMENVLRFVFTDYLNKLKAEKYWGSQTPRLVFQFEVAPSQALELIHAAHFLGVKHLLEVAATMVAHNLADVSDLSSLPPDLGWCIAEQLSPQDLFMAEERSDFLALNLNTECLWQRHCKNDIQHDITPVSSTSAYPSYDAWDADHGPPPTSWKSLYITMYLQQLADRQTGGDNKGLMDEVLRKGQHAYSMTIRPFFWEWVVNDDMDFFLTYMACFTNIFKLSMLNLPLGTSSKWLGELLKLLPLLQFLDLSEAGVGIDGAISLSKGLKEHKGIQVLRLGHNSIETSGFCALCLALPTVRTLRVLDVRENAIRAWVNLDAIDALKEAALEEFIVEGNFKTTISSSQSSLVTLPAPTLGSSQGDGNGYLESSKFDVVLKDLVMNGLPRNLRRLYYGKCNLTDVQAKVLCNSLSSVNCIKKLDLSCNKISSEGATAIFDWLHVNNTLVELDLSNNNITESCSRIMSRTLRNHATLEKLSLMENYTFGEFNLAEVLNAAVERGLKLHFEKSIYFTLDLRRTGISHLAQGRVQRQREHYSCVNLLI